MGRQEGYLRAIITLGLAMLLKAPVWEANGNNTADLHDTEGARGRDIGGQ